MGERKQILVCAGVVIWVGGENAGKLETTVDDVVVGDRVLIDVGTKLAYKRPDEPAIALEAPAEVQPA